MNDHHTGIAPFIDSEPMIDAKQAAAALSLPYYWFADQTMRSKYRIPHYLLGGLVRYRMSELSAWAAGSSAPQVNSGKQHVSQAAIANNSPDEGGK